MKNEVAFRFEDVSLVYIFKFMGARAHLTIGDNKMNKILTSTIESNKNTTDSLPELADTLYQQVDAQVRREYNLQAIVLKSIELSSEAKGVSVYALR